MKKNRVIMLIGTAALSACLVVGLTACGSTIDEAKSIRGEEVTEAEWKTALSEIATVNTAASLAASSAADEAESPNFSVSYQARSNATISYEGTDGEQSATFSTDITTTVSVADRKIHATMDYDISLTGSDDVIEMLKKLMKTDEDLTVKGTLETYFAFEENAVSLYLQNADGKWVKYSSVEDVTGVSTVVLGQIESCIGLMDCSKYADAFASFEYSDEDKGYALKGGVEGGDIFGADASFVIKIKDGRLAALVSEGSGETTIGGLSMSSSADTGLVYKFGGQTVKLPNV